MRYFLLLITYSLYIFLSNTQKLCHTLSVFCPKLITYSLYIFCQKLRTYAIHSVHFCPKLITYSLYIFLSKTQNSCHTLCVFLPKLAFPGPYFTPKQTPLSSNCPNLRHLSRGKTTLCYGFFPLFLTARKFAGLKPLHLQDSSSQFIGFFIISTVEIMKTPIN